MWHNNDDEMKKRKKNKLEMSHLSPKPLARMNSTDTNSSISQESHEVQCNYCKRKREEVKKDERGREKK